MPDMAMKKMLEDFEPHYGGFDGERKFPSPHKLLFLLRYWRERKDQKALDMATFDSGPHPDGRYKGPCRRRFPSLFDRSAAGIVPHFEKMLYDQALMLMALSEAYATTAKEEYRQAAEELLDYVEERLTSPEGGFYSSEDADAAGEEGSFYVWTYGELSALMTKEDLALFKDLYDVWDSGNYRDDFTRMRSGKNVLHMTSLIPAFANKKGQDPEALTRWDVQLRKRLKEARSKRPAPSRDDKILADWNGLMIVALCSAYRHLGSDRAVSMAEASPVVRGGKDDCRWQPSAQLVQ